MNTNKIISKISDLTKERPMFLHFDSLGLLYLGTSNQSRLDNFMMLLNRIEQEGGNIIIPSFSYSFCKNELFNIRETPTTLGKSHDILRLNNYTKRTSDGIFSYLIFGSHRVFGRHFGIMEYVDTFGGYSLLSEILELDGFIGSVGGVIQSTTEIHHVEKRLNVEYRFDKVFNGQVKDLEGEITEQRVTFFCRDLDFYNRTGLGSDLSKLYSDLEESGKKNEVNFDNEFLLDYVAYADIYENTKLKIQENPYYLLAERPDMFAG